MARSERDIISSAYTQTYSTAARTVSNATAVAVGDLVATQNTGWGASTEANFDLIATNLDAAIADILVIRKLITALIDDLQEQGIIQ